MTELRPAGVVAFTLVMLAAVLPSTGARAAGCKLGAIAELPATMSNLRPLVSAKINGVEVQFIADTGAFYSSITPGSAAQLKLPLSMGPFGLYITGVGGTADVSIAKVKTLTLAGDDLPGVDFLVAGSEVGENTAGLLGQNVLGLVDGEYDLANGMIRLMKPDNCAGAILAYWIKPDTPYSVVPMAHRDVNWRFGKLTPSPASTAYLNGVQIRVTFDTGAATSVLSLDAAARAGVKPDSPGVVHAGFSRGIGRRTTETWVAPFASFKIGDEEIKNTRLRIGRLGLDNTDMLLGADFFLSHHVYVANSQRKIYFTYNGGPVFNLVSTPALSAEPSAPLSTAAREAAPPPSPDEPKDADGYGRRGSAYLSRQEVAKALADLTRATELAPTEPQYFFERGRARIANKQPFLAMQDFDQALKLKPDLIPALIARGELRLSGRDEAAALTDFDAADRLAAKEADVRLTLGILFARMGRYGRAVDQLDQWLPAHPDDSRQSEALNGRCWGRAQLGRDLDKALADCDRSLRLNRSAAAYDSRGLVELRLARYDRAIADYDAALKITPKLAWSLYGRGLAKIKTGQTADGQADIAAAVAINAELPNLAKARGIAP
jgi:tetratricopeptide (TPR) repeat protein